VKPWQQIAFDNPCRLGEECAHPRFGRNLLIGSRVLTINSGYE
jgi:hypothetical protein